MKFNRVKIAKNGDLRSGYLSYNAGQIVDIEALSSVVVLVLGGECVVKSDNANFYRRARNIIFVPVKKLFVRLKSEYKMVILLLQFDLSRHLSQNDTRQICDKTANRVGINSIIALKKSHEDPDHENIEYVVPSIIRR